MTEIVVDARKLESDLAKVMRDVDKTVKKNTRRQVAAAAKIVVDAQRAAVRGVNSAGVSGGGSRSRAWARAAGKQGPLTERLWRSINKRSGLRESVASSVRVVNRARGDGYQLTVRVEPSRMPSDQRKLPTYMDVGRWRHPVYNRGGWAGQTVSPPGWFTKTAETKAPAVYEKLSHILDGI